MQRSIQAISGSFLALAFSCLSTAHAAPAAAVDTAFVGKVSQGGRYEVEASKMAVDKAVAQDVKDLANTEVHDHQLVGDELKSISASEGIAIAPTLNAELQGKLDMLKAASGKDFDTAYLAEMKRIHAKDYAIFVTESKQGGSAEFRAFATKTSHIVKRHIGALDAY